jgi:hypothetical protein
MKIRKTKSGPGMEGIIVPFAALILAGFGWLLMGMTGFFTVMLAIFGAYSVLSLIFFLKTFNISYLAAAIFQVLIAIYMATLPKGILPFSDKRVSMFFYLCGLAVALWMLYMAVNKKSRWKGREVFELSAANAGPSTHGFTERPLPAGNVECTRLELLGLADYLKRNLVALAYWDNSTIYFVPVRMGQEYSMVLGMSPHYFQKTWISFDKEGNVTVKISRKDYYQYVDELEFDQLCQNMGDLFIEFFEDYKKGDELRILNKLDSVGMNFFS